MNKTKRFFFFWFFQGTLPYKMSRIARKEEKNKIGEKKMN